MIFKSFCLIQLLTGLLQITVAKIQIWKIDEKSFEMIPIDTGEFNGLKSNEAYVVLEEKPESTTANVIYYWVGKDTPEKIPGYAAFHTIRLDSERNTDTTIPMCLRIRREVEGEESLTFRMLFPEPSGAELVKIVDKVFEGVDINATRLFYVEENGERLLLREEMFKLQYILGDHKICLITLSENMYVCCGKDASWRLKEKSKDVAKVMVDRKQLKKDTIIIDRSEKQEDKIMRDYISHFLRSTAVVPQHNISHEPFILSPRKAKMEVETKPVPSSNKNQNLSLEGKDPTVKIIFYLGGVKIPDAVTYWGTYNNLGDDLEQNKCALIDSKDYSLGIFIWMGKEADLVIRSEAAGIAENYIAENYRYAMPVTFFDQADLPPNVKTFRDLYSQLRRPIMVN